MASDCCGSSGRSFQLPVNFSSVEIREILSKIVFHLGAVLEEAQHTFQRGVAVDERLSIVLCVGQ